MLEAPSSKTEVAWMWLLAAFVCFAGMSLWGAVTSDGFLEADGTTHYNYARFAVDHPHLLLDVWGRPLVTGIHALPAYYFGRIGVRITSLVIALLCGWATYRIAVNQGYKQPVAAPIFLFAQPLMFLHSFAELTELPFALLVILAFWAYQQRRYFVMAVLVALSPIGRPEGFGFMLLAAFALVCHRRWWWIALLPLPLALWSWTGYVHSRLLGPAGLGEPMEWWQWLSKNWPYAKDSNYGSGPIWHYVVHLPIIVGFLLVPGAIIGGWQMLLSGYDFTWRSPVYFTGVRGWLFGWVRHFVVDWIVKNPKLFGTDHRARCEFVIAAIPFGILLTHSIFWYFGKFSGGELRYHLIVGPFWALVVAKGYEIITARLNLTRPLFIAAVLAITPLVANKLYRIVPIHFSRDELVAKQIVEEYLQNPAFMAKYPKLTSPSPMVYYFRDVCLTDPDHVGPWWRERLENPAPGQYLIYETVLANWNSDERMLVSQELLEKHGWVFLHEYAREWKYGRWCVWATYLSPQSIDGQPTEKR